MTSQPLDLSSQPLEPEAAKPPADAETLLKRAFGHLARGETDAALQAASDALHVDPKLPEAHFAYGEIWTSLGRHDKAEQAFTAAIKLRPDWADAWVNHGVARYRQGAIEDARSDMREALRHVPEHPAARANLDALQRMSGEPEAAENPRETPQKIEQEIKRSATPVGEQVDLVAELLRQERGAEALDLLPESRFPAEDAPAARQWLLQRSLALLQLGRVVEARSALEKMLTLGPLPANIAPSWLWRLVLLAEAERDRPRARENAALMEQALNGVGADAAPELQVIAHADLAKFWSGQSEPGRAFPHWVAAHRLLRRSEPFSREDTLAFVEASRKAFGRQRFAPGEISDNRDPTPVFIVGMPHSGTAVVEQILSAHAQAHGAGERAALGRSFYALSGRADDLQAVGRIAALDKRVLDGAADVYLRHAKALAPDKARILDRMASNFSYLGLVGLMLPGARLIHCRRDPRDLGLAIFTSRVQDAHGYAHDLGDLGWTIGQHDRLMAHWKQAMPNPILDIWLEDWLRDFDGTLGRLLDHVGLPPDPNCAGFREPGRQLVNVGELGGWKVFERELAPLIAELDAADALP